MTNFIRNRIHTLLFKPFFILVACFLIASAPCDADTGVERIGAWLVKETAERSNIFTLLDSLGKWGVVNEDRVWLLDYKSDKLQLYIPHRNIRFSRVKSRGSRLQAKTDEAEINLNVSNNSLTGTITLFRRDQGSDLAQEYTYKVAGKLSLPTRTWRKNFNNQLNIISDKEDLIRLLKSERKDVRDDLDAARSGLNQLRSIKENLNEELFDTKGNLSEKSKKLESLEAQLSSHKNRIEELQDQLQTAKSQTSTIEKENKSVQEFRDKRLAAALKREEKKYQKKAQENEVLKSRFLKLNTTMKKVIQSKIKAAVDKASGEIIAKASQLEKDLEQVTKKLETTSKQLESEKQHLQKELDNADDQIKTLTLELAELNTTRNSVVTDSDKLKERFAKTNFKLRKTELRKQELEMALKNVVAEKDDQIEKLNLDVSRLNKTRTFLNTEIMNLQETLEDTKHTLSGIELQNKELTELKKIRTSLEAENDTLQDAFEDTKLSLRKLELQNKELMMRNKELIMQNKELNAHSKKYDSQLLSQACTRKLETAQTQKNNLSKELGLLKGRIEREYNKAKEKGLSDARQHLERLNVNVEKLDADLKLSETRLKNSTLELNTCQLDLRRTIKRNKKLRSQASSE